MWVFVGRIALGVAACAASVSLLGGSLAPAYAQAPAKPAQQPAKPAPSAQPSPADVCNGLTGADAAQKVIACTEAIKNGSLVGGPLALAYLNRGLSESGAGSPTRSKADFREAIRIFNDAINAQPTNPYLYTQRGVVYQTIGEADRAIIDYSDAIRLAPRETYPLINRAVVLYTRKDNNEGAIADLTAALKINIREISAWINRGIVYRASRGADGPAPEAPGASR